MRRGHVGDTDSWTDDEDLQRIITDRIDNDAAF